LRRYCNPDSTQPVGGGHSPPCRPRSRTCLLDVCIPFPVRVCWTSV
jgi:hypothetical protein